MEVLMSSENTTETAEDVREAFGRSLEVLKEVALEYLAKKNDRTLVILRLCPCCTDISKNPLLQIDNAVFVSIYTDGKKTVYGKKFHYMDKLPPLAERRLKESAKDMQEYRDSVRASIDRALA